MDKKISEFIPLLFLMLVLVFIPGKAYAFAELYINDEPAGQSIDELYAVGGDGISRLENSQVYVLSASGIEQISGWNGGDTPASEAEGGGGLRYDDGMVSVKSDIVLVGLRYFYSSSRDGGMERANLENAEGEGYRFGYYTDDREFVELGRTSETQITMRVTSGTGIGVYITGTDILLYEQNSTGPRNMLAVSPLCEYGEAVTWFSGNKYYGDFEYAVLGGGKISVINAVDIEKYVMGVCSREMSSGWPLEALKAQAVAARTYAGRNIRNSVYYYNCGFDLTGDTYSQAYSGCANVTDDIVRAVEETENEYLTYNGELCDAQYFSSDGGATEDNENVNGNSYHPYLKGVIDPYESDAAGVNHYSSWTYTMKPEYLGSKVGLSDVSEVYTEYSNTGNVIEIELVSSSGNSIVLSRGSCRTSLGLPSIRYHVYKNDAGQFVFEGSGWGHNLGMSQYGAYAMALYYGKTYKDILGFYYTGVGLSYGVIY